MTGALGNDKPVVLVGQGRIAHCVYSELQSQGREVMALVAHRRFLLGSPIWAPQVACIALEGLLSEVEPTECEVFVAVGYQKRNSLRRALLDEVVGLGYHATNVVPPNAGPVLSANASNVLVMQGAHVQSGAQIGMNTFVWSGAIVGHHSIVGEDCWIASGAALGGEVTVGRACFVGLAATVAHGRSVGGQSIVGAGALVAGDLEAESVAIAEPSPKHRLRSSQYAQLFSWV